MSVYAGPKILTDSLIFYFDASNLKNQADFNNLFVNGSFQSGLGMPAEDGSNPTNTIISLPNPGDSSFVLRQSGNNTEYQLNLSNLTSSTTYVMSGWYAKSTDYDSSDTMFHSRAFSSSGNHNATGTGIGTTIRTVLVNNLVWQFGFQTITTPSDANGEFDWYVGYGANNTAGFRYYTNLRFEKGNFPSLQDLSLIKSTSTFQNGISYDNDGGGCVVLDGTDDEIVLPVSDLYNTASFSIEAWVKLNSDGSRHILLANWSGYALEVNSDGTVITYTNSSGGQGQVGTATSTAINWQTWTYLVGLYDASTSESRTYINGVLRATRASTNSISYSVSVHKISPSDYSGGFVNGKIAILKQYNRALSDFEIIQNFNATRSRFGI